MSSDNSEISCVLFKINDITSETAPTTVKDLYWNLCWIAWINVLLEMRFSQNPSYTKYHCIIFHDTNRILIVGKQNSVLHMM